MSELIDMPSETTETKEKGPEVLEAPRVQKGGKNPPVSTLPQKSRSSEGKLGQTYYVDSEEMVHTRQEDALDSDEMLRDGRSEGPRR